MTTRELVFRTLLAFFVISNCWFWYQIYPFIEETSINIDKISLTKIIRKSIIIGVLLSVPFGIMKYRELKKAHNNK